MGTLIDCQTKKINGYSILQWNTLCSKYATKESFPNVEESYLNWSYRKELIKKYLLNEKPDILTIEEIDNYDEYKKEILDELEVKYSGNFFERDDKTMGIFIGINSEKFTIIDQRKEILDGLDNEEKKEEKKDEKKDEKK